MPTHASLTGADLHEPKGADTATSGTVYVSDGAGSGAWSLVEAENVSIADTNGLFTSTDVEGALEELYSSFGLIGNVFQDISNAETILLPIPFSCVVETISITLNNAITTANSNVTITRSDGASLGAPLVITQLGSAEGTRFTFTPSSNETLTFPTHTYIKMVSDGGSSTACRAYVQMKIRRGT